ncbi:MAG: cation-translocating P-type ATPase, partial [Acidimicrobiales bacterium]|nr:cation-translocating P-type ATPase [Acidimicrobiales bacterium]
DVVVLRDDLRVVPAAVDLARRTLRTIHVNLVWAFAYNVVAIPLAALGLLDPLVAAAAMAASSGFVVWNSARLRHWTGPEAVGPPTTHPSSEPSEASDRSVGGTEAERRLVTAH